jgi:GNAT superfamily N-acetyltransferase
VPARFDVRAARPADAAIIAWHRARMFQDMGDVPPELFDELRTTSQAYIGEALARHEYVGWLASPAGDPEIVVAGAGAQLRRAFPHMLKLPDGPAVAQGRHAIVLNVFTEPEWRRQRLAELLVRQVIAWAREEQLDRLVLHASPQGHALYERLGFKGTNEMRFQGILRGFIEEP